MYLYRLLRVIGDLKSSPFLLGPGSPFMFGATINSHTSKYTVAGVALEILKKLLKEILLMKEYKQLMKGLNSIFQKCLQALRDCR